ncbi:hypothetical protein ON010_g9372 [Phytophthora cinnamomi]|nr:hypothetical protein ON010_g9372 [Phytophthora cinnamomi]
MNAGKKDERAANDKKRRHDATRHAEKLCLHKPTREVQSEVLQEQVRVRRPATRDSSCNHQQTHSTFTSRDAVAQRQVPADEPRRQLTEGDPHIHCDPRKGRKTYRHTRCELRVRERREDAGDAAHEEGQRDAGARDLRAHAHERVDAGAHGAAHTICHQRLHAACRLQEAVHGGGREEEEERENMAVQRMRLWSAAASCNVSQRLTREEGEQGVSDDGVRPDRR